MAMGITESVIETIIVKHAEDNGYLVRKLSWIGRTSAPDRMFMKKSQAPRLLEFKAPGKKPTKKQELEHKRLREHGVEVYVVDSLEEGQRVLGI